MAAETLLSSLLCLLFLGFLLPARLAGGVGSLNLEELSEMRYGIEILPLPVIGGQVNRRKRGEGPGRKRGPGTVEEEERCGVGGGRLEGREEQGGLSCDRGTADSPAPRGPGPGRGGLRLSSFGSGGTQHTRLRPAVPAPAPPLQTEDLWLLLPSTRLFPRVSRGISLFSPYPASLPSCPRPPLPPQSQASDVVIVSSKYKQRYECRLPAGAIHFQREREEETPAYQGPGIPELLNPMRDAPCLLKTKDWWTYQFCYGRHIQQYHMEDSEIKGDILYLGYYQSAFDWDDETAKASKQHRLKRYHSQTYGNGSKCDLNGRPREAEVRFLCDEGAGISGDYIDRVDEPLSCSYVLTVRTPRLCAHPLLRPSPSAAPQAILCHPSLQPEEYKAYLRQQEREDSKQQEEKITEQLQDLDSPVRSETKSGAPPPKREGVSPAKDDSQESDFWQMLREPEDEAPGGEEAQAEEQHLNLEAAAHPAPGPPDDFQNNVQVKVIRSPSDLIRLIEELKGGTKKGKPSAGAEQPGDVAAEEGPAREPEGKAKGDPERPSAGDEAEREEDEEEEADEQQLLGEFEKELEGILLPSDRERLQRLRSQLKAGAERERELESATQETPDSTPTGAFQTEKELNTDMLKKESERERAILALTSTVNKLIKRLEENQSRELAKKYRKRKAVPRKPLPAPHSAEEDPEHRVRVRVTKLRHGGPNQDLTVLEMKRENPQLKQIEGLVKELLEREGLTAEGKIEIKIVRPGAEGPEEDGRWLTDEDTKSLKEIFFNILGAEEAHKERQRQKDLESNYRRVWGSRDGEGLGDLDEFDF